VSSDVEAATAAIVMVASGTQAAALVLPANAELGRRIAAAGTSHEVADDRMSRDHATVRRDRGAWRIVDLDSRNGTFVDGERIAARAEVVRRGDVVLRLGHTVFLLLADGRAGEVRDGAIVIGPELARVFDEIRRYASGDVLVVEGEAGTGKQIAARVFHDASRRAAGPFVVVNCAAIPEGVAERLLFGGKKGAIETIGQLQMARGGTLLLEQVDQLHAGSQATLSRLLDHRDRRDPDVGIVLAGTALHEAVERGQLRQDLYARARVELPPLRGRRIDIVRLVQLEAAPRSPHPRLLESCCLRPWPGNAGELRTAIRQATANAALAERDIVRLEDLPETAGMPPGTSSGETAVERKVPPRRRG
jgi:transcriptional regulator of acetoin/glycerol metabolism